MAQKSTVPTASSRPGRADTDGPFAMCAQADHNRFHTLIEAQASLGTLRRNRLGETGQMSLTANLMTPADRLMLYTGVNSYLNSDSRWQEPQVLAGLKLQIPLGPRMGLRNETELRYNLAGLPLSYAERQKYLTTHVALTVKPTPATTLETSYTFKFSNDYIPDGETNYAQVDSWGFPELVHTEILALMAKRQKDGWMIKANVQAEPDLATPASPDTGWDWLGAGIGADWSPRTRVKTSPLRVQADIQYTHAPGLRDKPGLAARLTARYCF